MGEPYVPPPRGLTPIGGMEPWPPHGPASLTVCTRPGWSRCNCTRKPEKVSDSPPVRTLKSQGMAGTDRPPHFLGELHSAWESSLLGTRVLRRHILSQEPAQTRKDEKHRSLPGAQKPNAGLEGREKPVSKRGPRGWRGRRPRPGLSEQQVPCPADEATAPRPLLVIACQVP